LTYVDELEQHRVENALRFEAVEGTPEEWSNIPKLVARYCIRLQQHVAALTEYTEDRSKEETSHSLREFIED